MVQKITEMFVGAYTREIITDPPPPWTWNNPSIAQGPDGEYRCIVRSASYVYREGQFVPTQPDGMVRTKNYLCDLDDDLEIQTMELIDDSAAGLPLFPWVQGNEDCRLFWWDSAWWACGVSRQHREDGLPQMALDLLDGPRVVGRRILLPDNPLCQKNWTPILGTSKFLYQTFPPSIYDLETDSLKSLWRPGLPPVPKEPLRGGTQLLPLPEGGYISVSHEVTFEPTRHYWARFVRYDDEAVVTGYSEKFYFITPGCEFAAGIVEWGDYLVVSFGSREESANFAYVPKALALESCNPKAEGV